MRRAERSNERWVRHYESLQWHFSPEEAHEYAEELTEGEHRTAQAARSPQEIKGEMEMIGHIEASIQTLRVLVGIAAFFCPLALVSSLESHFCDDRCKNMLASIPPWVSTLLLIAFTFGSIFFAVAICQLSFWKRYLDLLRRKRLQSFWEWRSATLRFPTGHMIYSGDFDRTEPPDVGEPQKSRLIYSTNGC